MPNQKTRASSSNLTTNFICVTHVNYDSASAKKNESRRFEMSKSTKGTIGVYACVEVRCR